MAARQTSGLGSKLRQMSGEGLSSLVREWTSNEAVRRRLRIAARRLRENRTALGEGLESLMELANLPSKRDIRELNRRLDHLNSQLVNLGLKVDRALGGRKSRPSAKAAQPAPQENGPR
jgi:hypothetical protein